MPKFYFDVREGARFVGDDEGIELPDLDRAERELAELAAAIGRDLLPRCAFREITAEVRNEEQQRVLTATVSMRVQRVAPPSGTSRASATLPDDKSERRSRDDGLS